ncbi:hypothetical protein, partial [Ferrimicrobium sp.]|uniref:hypothetical protein n=1 Tax=Ferrimicrobium sp. TaxID=2926050 RepID=UPI0026175346
MPCSFDVRQRAILWPPACSFGCPLTPFFEKMPCEIYTNAKISFDEAILKALRRVLAPHV